MRATTNGGNLTLPAPAGGVKSGVPVYLSDALAIVPQSDFAEGESMAGETTGIEITVEIDGDCNAYDPIRINAENEVTVGKPANGFAKLGVAKFDAVQRTRPHIVTAAEDAANTYGAAVAGDEVEQTYFVVKVIVQAI